MNYDRAILLEHQERLFLNRTEIKGKVREIIDRGIRDVIEIKTVVEDNLSDQYQKYIKENNLLSDDNIFNFLDYEDFKNILKDDYGYNIHKSTAYFIV